MKRSPIKRKVGLRRGKSSLKRSGKLRPVSKRKLGRMAEYRAYRDEYMRQHPFCEVEGCWKPSTDPHHTLGRGKHLCEGLKAVCHSCHRRIHDDPAWARSQGLLFALGK